MKNYRYTGYEFHATEAICANNGRWLYEIEGMKPAGTRPFLTSIAEVREFIADAVEMGYWLDAHAYSHPINRD